MSYITCRPFSALFVRMRGCSFVCCKSDWLNATTDPINLSRPNRCITHATSPRKSETHRMSYMPARTKCLGSHLGLTHSYTLQDSHSLTRMTCTRNLMPKRTSSCKSADASTFSFSTSWATIRPSVAPHDLSKQKNNRALPLRRTSFFCLFHWVLWFHSNHTAGNIQVLVRNQPRSLPR